MVTDDAELSFPELNRRQKVGVGFCMVLAAALIGGLWLQPWRVAAGNPSLAGRPTATATAGIVGGCATSDDRNYFSCAQYLEFDVGSVRIHGRVLVVDEYRKVDEAKADVPVVYDTADPTQFRLQQGNPGIARRVLGTAFLTLTSVGLGVMAGGALAVGLDRVRRRIRGADEPRIAASS